MKIRDSEMYVNLIKLTVELGCTNDENELLEEVSIRVRDSGILMYVVLIGN